MMLVLLALACGPKEGDSGATEDVEVTYPPVTGDPCDAITLRVDGNDPPVVGDAWTVWLYCDDALLTGTTILQFDPPDLATVTDNNATFLAAGEGLVRMQVGSRRAERDVVVAAAR